MPNTNDYLRHAGVLRRFLFRNSSFFNNFLISSHADMCSVTYLINMAFYIYIWFIISSHGIFKTLFSKPFQFSKLHDQLTHTFPLY